MVVVPRLAQGRQREPQQVARLVAGLEATSSEEVTQRVDRERGVVQEQDAHRAAPQQTREPADDRPGERNPEAEWEGHPEHHPQEKGSIDETRGRIGQQILGVALRARSTAARATERPAEMRVVQAAQRSTPAIAVSDVRAVGIALLVGEAVVLTMRGDPLDHRPLDRGRAERAQHDPHRRARLEAAVGEQAVIADRHAETRQQVGDRQHDQVLPLQDSSPRQPGRPAEQSERHDRHDHIGDPIEHLVLPDDHVLAGPAHPAVCLRGGHESPLPGRALDRSDRHTSDGV